MLYVEEFSHKAHHMTISILRSQWLFIIVRASVDDMGPF